MTWSARPRRWWPRCGTKAEFDFVAEVSGPFPLLVICDLMGIPRDQHQMVLEQSNIILSGGDPEFIPEGTDPITAFIGAGAMLAELMGELRAERLARPTDDLTSALVNTSVDGEQLTAEELASFFILLAVAGNETTRTATSHGVALLDANPDQRRHLGGRRGGRHDHGGGGDRPLLVAGGVDASHPDPGPRALGPPVSAGARRCCCSTGRPTAMRRCSPIRTVSTCVAIRTRTSASAGPDPTSAWAPTWPVERSPSCSVSFSLTCPI